MIGNGRDIGTGLPQRQPEAEAPRSAMEPRRPGEETQETNAGACGQQPQCHIFTYESPWKIYALGYSWRPDHPYRFGLGSFLEDKVNKVRSHANLFQIEIIQLSEETKSFVRRQVFDHQYPPTKLMWIPDRVSLPRSDP